MDIAKINFAMTYLTGVAQDLFEVGLNQKDQDILQDWLSDWNLFVDELCRHFGLLDSVGEAANMLDNLYMKPSDKISTHNVDFMRYVSQLGWRIVFCAITITRGSPIGFRIPSLPGNKENPPCSRICMP